MKILIADDDLVSRTMLAGILPGWGYEVTLAGDGPEAWRVLQTDRLFVAGAECTHEAPANDQRGGS